MKDSNWSIYWDIYHFKNCPCPWEYFSHNQFPNSFYQVLILAWGFLFSFVYPRHIRRNQLAWIILKRKKRWSSIKLKIVIKQFIRMKIQMTTIPNSCGNLMHIARCTTIQRGILIQPKVCDLYLPFQVFLNGPIPASLCLFSSFSHHNSIINWKSLEVVIGDRTWGGRMVGADGSTEI